MNTLVLGGSQFIGLGVVRHLQAVGHDVTVLDMGNRTVADTEQLAANRNDPDAMIAALGRRQFDLVVDCSGVNAAQVAAARRALESRFGHWVHISDAAVYAPHSARPLNEDCSVGGDPAWGYYAANKSKADEFLLASREHSGTTILRPPYVYGPGNNTDREQFIWARLLRGLPIVMHGRGDRWIQFVHVDDLAHAVNLAWETRTPGVRVYNVGCEEAVRQKEWVQLLAEVAGVPDKVVLVLVGATWSNAGERFPFRDTDCWLDVRKVGRDLGWEPRYEIREGFAQTFAACDAADLSIRPFCPERWDQLVRLVFGALNPTDTSQDEPESLRLGSPSPCWMTTECHLHEESCRWTCIA